MVDETFERGRALLRENNTLAALACFEKTWTGSEVRGVGSYFGLCLALERGQTKEGIALCTQAIAEDPEDPVHYLHLGRIYLREKRKVEAIDIFRKGLSHGDSAEIKRILDGLGLRKKPVFPFLRRDHPLNKYTGKLLRSLRLR